ncbi:MAG: hypothetical protein LBG88_02610 [Christensenellaceae bacterium]|nr:hypothetical protein [Christensenellaceae bacterium]
MNSLFSLLNAGDGSKKVKDVLTSIKGATGIMTTVVLAVCASAVIFYAIYIGVRLASATDDGKRTQAKQQLIWSVVALLSIGVLTTIYTLVLDKTLVNINFSGAGPTDDLIKDELVIIKDSVKIVMDICIAALPAFALWVCWQLMKAEDEGKRKNAKMQLLYTIIGAVAVVGLYSLCDAVFSNMK